IMSIPFHIFGSNILVFHITQALLFTLLSYFLFDLLEEKSWIIFIFFFFPVSIFFPGYNLLLFFLLILIIWLEKKKYNDIVIGIIIALAFLTKQTVGIVFLLPSSYYIKDIKKVLKRLVGFIIPNILFFIYLICTNTYREFFDLCILGLFDFAGNNGHISTIWIILILIMVIITIIYIKKNNKEITLFYILSYYTIAIPLFDIKHCQEAFLAFLFMILYYSNRKTNIKYLLVFMVVVANTSYLYFHDRIKTEIVYPNNIKYFEYRLLDKDSIKLTNDLNKYLKKHKYKKFVFLDLNGYYFKIINDIKIDNTDLINTGNSGYNGKNKLLKEIKKKKDYIFIVDKEELKRKHQTDKDVIKYIIKNGKKIDRIRGYDIYTMEEI
ncbi:MAG: hypothetical protein IJF92_06350, partial [Bacilli bacterium]|nr:hypothetical protein [Bacilli bacterium]